MVQVAFETQYYWELSAGIRLGNNGELTGLENLPLVHDYHFVEVK